MTRHVFAREGVAVLHRRTIEVGAIKWEDGEEFPVIWGFDFNKPEALIGKATDLRREDDGWITAELEFKGPHKEPFAAVMDKTFYATFYGTEVDWLRTDTEEFVRDCRLQAVCIVIGDPWVKSNGD